MSETSNTPYRNDLNDGEKYKVKKRKQKIYLNIIDGKNKRGYENDYDYMNDDDYAVYEGKSRQDPLGMYTGVPDNPYERPVQDADDL